MRSINLIIYFIFLLCYVVIERRANPSLIKNCQSKMTIRFYNDSNSTNNINVSNDICQSVITNEKAYEGFDIPMNNYILPDDFLEQLKNVVRSAPCDGKSRRKMIIMTVFSNKHKLIVSNLLCSITRIKNYSKNYHIFISYDEEGFNYLNQFRQKFST